MSTAQKNIGDLTLREKFHDINNALQGISNLIITLRRDETYTPEIGDLLNVTFLRVKESVEAARSMAIEGKIDNPTTHRPAMPIRFPVLLIDADPLSRRMSTARLKALGYIAVSVDGEEAALEALATTKDIRVALVDCADQQKTIRLCEALLKVAPHLGVILSCNESATLPDATALGFTPLGVLIKPLKAHRVEELIGMAGRNERTMGNIEGNGAKQ